MNNKYTKKSHVTKLQQNSPTDGKNLFAKPKTYILLLLTTSLVFLLSSILLLFNNSLLRMKVRNLSKALSNREETIINIMSAEPTPIKPVSTKQIPTPTELPFGPNTIKDTYYPKCNKNECLYKFESSYLGYATLKGYYQQYDGTEWEWGRQEAICDSLVVTDGTDVLIEEFENDARNKNNLNKFIDGKFYVNLNLTDLTSDQKNAILESSPNNPIEIGVIRKFMAGAGVSTCYSLVDIIFVKPL